MSSVLDPTSPKLNEVARSAQLLRVALVVMPFASGDRPSLATGLLKAALARVGVECEVKHFNLTFWKMLGERRYRAISQVLPNTVLAGEWLFSQVFWGRAVSDWDRYEAEILDDPLWGMGADKRGIIREALALAPSFIRLAYESNDWSRFDVVGFTSTFEQTMASLCLARLIREEGAGPRLALGGANFEAGMGLPYLEHFSFIDYVSIGEADQSFPALCQRLARAKAEGLDVASVELPRGILGRADLRRGLTPLLGKLDKIVPSARSPEVVEALDDLPTPDFQEYFEVAAKIGFDRPRGRAAVGPWLSVETSRGCWWGRKNHCTFCGLNGDAMGFRRKGAARVRAELAELEARHGRRPIQFTDNILSHDFFKDLIPSWAAEPEPVRKFFEIKANLRRGQVEALAAAGIVQVQPGIESLDDATLVEMRKGVSAAQNVALLRWAAESGVRAYWNILFGFPREPADSYSRQLELLPRLSHLRPPTACALIRLDRFSPNFDEWREHGFSEVEPLSAYRHIFPFDPEDIARLAYFFRYQHPQLEAAITGGRALVSAVQRWRRAHAAGEVSRLELEIVEGEAVLIDERPLLGAPLRPPRRLSAVELALVLACDRPRRPAAALEAAREARGAEGAGEPEEALARLREDAVVLGLGGLLITAALLPSPVALAELKLAAGAPSWLSRAP